MVKSTACNGRCHIIYKNSFYLKKERSIFIVENVYFHIGFLGFKRCYLCQFWCITDDRFCGCCNRKMGGMKDTNHLFTQTSIDKKEFYNIHIRDIHALALEFYNYKPKKIDRRKLKSKRPKRLLIKKKGYKIPADCICFDCNETETYITKGGLAQWTRLSKSPVDKNKFLCRKCTNRRKYNLLKQRQQQKQQEGEGGQQLKTPLPFVVRY